MKKELPIDSIRIDSNIKIPIYKQLYDLIRKGIISNQFTANSLLPSTRQLAKELSISRSTVTSAYDQLIAEGFLISKKGSGTVIAEVITQSIQKLSNKKEINNTDHSIDLSLQISNMAKAYCSPTLQNRVRTNYQHTTLMPGIPSRHNFPHLIWGRVLSKYAKNSLGIDAGYDHPSGIPQLKKAIANYIHLARGVNTDESDILIVTSTQAALDLLCRALLNKNENAAIEEPGYSGAYIAMRNIDANIQSIHVDDEGMIIPTTQNIPKVIYTSPSHQYPTGVTMSYTRRMAILEYAKQHQSWILEDDYDSEFRYRGKPLPCLQGLDQNQRVIYLGTFSKSLSPSIRVAYIVAPPALSPILKTLLGDIGSGTNINIQYALAEFIEAGHYSRHIRKARKEYAEKQSILIKSIEKNLADKVEFFQSNAGLQTVLYFKKGIFKRDIDDKEFVTLAEKEGLYLRALSDYYHAKQVKQGLVLGFAASDKDEIERAVIKLSKLISRI